MDKVSSLKTVFLEALELPALERAAYLERECAGDDELRLAALELLTLHERAAGFLEPAGSPAAAPEPLAEGPGTHIGSYRLVQVLGEGGFGTVFLAEQERPVRRMVALKIIKLGMDTRQVIARFEAERQALAMMEHPGIAAVYDAGSTQSGRPYFVMELVRGQPITEHCDEHGLSVESRCELFLEVCRAVQHAHTKGVIHRDLKPSNVLVTMTDGKSRPKVIDFGISKATSQRLTEKTIATERYGLIGTPEYMSPEQAELAGADIDTRSDIYSLGVLLYELLAGALPFDRGRIRSAPYGEIQRIIREEEPPRPSARLRVLEELPRVAARRQTEPSQLIRRVQGDLDWIVMRCLDKDRSRRYETADGLAQDVQMHLAGLPILAAPPSAAYRMRKFVRRHRAGALTGLAVAITLVGGIVGTTAAMLEALDEKARADEAAKAESLARQEAQASAASAAVAEEQARNEAARAVQFEQEARRRAEELALVGDFQASQVTRVDPAKMGAGLRAAILAEHAALLKRKRTEAEISAAARQDLELALAEVNFTDVALGSLDESILTPALNTIQEQFETQPGVKMLLLHSVGGTYHSLGLYRSGLKPLTEALELSRDTLGEDHPFTLLVLNDLGALLEAQGRYSQAEVLWREMLDREPSLTQEQLISALHNLGATLLRQGRLSDAEPLLRRSLDECRSFFGEDHSFTLSSLTHLGFALFSRGALAEAEPHMRAALEGARRMLGPDDSLALTALNNLGGLLEHQGRLDEAEQVFREAFEAQRRVLGADHLDTLAAMLNVGHMCSKRGALEEAELLLREALERSERALGPRHGLTLAAKSHLGVFLREAGELEEAERLLFELVSAARATRHPNLGTFLSSHALTLSKLGRLDEAEPALLESHALLAEQYGAAHERTSKVVAALSELYETRHASTQDAHAADQAELWRARLEGR